jgi:hypothetical protein
MDPQALVPRSVVVPGALSGMVWSQIFNGYGDLYAMSQMQ